MGWIVDLAIAPARRPAVSRETKSGGKGRACCPKAVSRETCSRETATGLLFLCALFLCVYSSVLSDPFQESVR